MIYSFLSLSNIEIDSDTSGRGIFTIGAMGHDVVSTLYVSVKSIMYPGWAVLNSNL